MKKFDYKHLSTLELESTFDWITTTYLGHPDSIMEKFRSDLGEELNCRFPLDPKFSLFAPKSACEPDCSEKGLNEPLDPSYVSEIVFSLSPSITDPTAECYATVYIKDARGYNHYPTHIPRASDNDFFIVVQTILNRLIANKKNCNEFG